MSSEGKHKTAEVVFKLPPTARSSIHPLLAVLTVIEEHVDRVERCPADGEQHDDGDHHFDGSLLLPVGRWTEKSRPRQDRQHVNSVCWLLNLLNHKELANTHWRGSLLMLLSERFSCPSLLLSYVFVVINVSVSNFITFNPPTNPSVTWVRSSCTCLLHHNVALSQLSKQNDREIQPYQPSNSHSSFKAPYRFAQFIIFKKNAPVKENDAVGLQTLASANRVSCLLRLQDLVCR